LVQVVHAGGPGVVGGIGGGVVIVPGAGTGKVGREIDISGSPVDGTAAEESGRSAGEIGVGNVQHGIIIQKDLGEARGLVSIEDAVGEINLALPGVEAPAGAAGGAVGDKGGVIDIQLALIGKDSTGVT